MTPKDAFYPYVACGECEGGYYECYCGSNCCSGEARCEACEGENVVCSRCKFYYCNCPEPSALEHLAKAAE